MRISTEDLPQHLKRGLGALYVIHGEALLLAIEAADAIRNAAREAGYTERETIIAEQYFKWGELRNSAQSMSLFSSRKVIDLRIPSGKPGVEGAQALQDHCENLDPDTLTLISLPKLEGTALKSKWFAALEQHGTIISADEVSLAALPTWIAGRLRRQGQSADADTLKFLADKVEGNLLAAYQEIQKLALLFPEGTLTFDQVKDSVMDVARYDVFKLSEAMLLGDAERYARILDGLRAEGTATVLILWAIAEDIRALAKVSRAMQQSGNLAGALRDARVWGAKQKLIERSVRRFTPTFAERALRQAALIDRLIKGLRQGDVWDELLQLGVRCARAGAR
ncbi:MAG: DNA polymerase III subunit delta [Sideroxydans sp.]|nr:DNA polymerase III subunit delta [Sideroxydans sp.]